MHNTSSSIARTAGILFALSGNGCATETSGQSSPDTDDGQELSGGGGTATGSGGGGADPTGGAGTGGSFSTGGESSSGANTGTGGDSETGGTSGSGGDVGTGGEGSDECVIGQTQGSEVAVIGESFIAATHEITTRIEQLAREQGSLGPSENYIDESVSGTTLANNQIPGQYIKALESSDHIKYVLMDGGGNDCLLNNNGAAALQAAEDLFETMAENNTEKVVYFFYPDPIGSNFNNLKACLDDLRPQMKALCDGLTAPQCYWLDQREIWDGHPEYTNDGIHPTQAGSYASAEGIWEVMQDNCVAQ